MARPRLGNNRGEEFTRRFGGGLLVNTPTRKIGGGLLVATRIHKIGEEGVVATHKKSTHKIGGQMIVATHKKSTLLDTHCDVRQMSRRVVFCQCVDSNSVIESWHLRVCECEAGDLMQDLARCVDPNSVIQTRS